MRASALAGYTALCPLLPETAKRQTLTWSAYTVQCQDQQALCTVKGLNATMPVLGSIEGSINPLKGTYHGQESKDYHLVSRC